VNFIGMLQSGISKNIYPPAHEELLDLIKNVDIVGLAWRAATAQRLQPRAAGSLKENREALARIAGTEEHLPLPEWLNEPLDTDLVSEEASEEVAEKSNGGESTSGGQFH
jgi:hypothetical protein